MPEDLCFGLMEKYFIEQETLKTEIATLEDKIAQTESVKQNVDDLYATL